MSSPPQDDRESDESKKVDPLDPDVGLGEQDAEDGLLSDVYADSLDWNQCLMIERIADAFEKQWRAGKDPQVADFLEHIGDDLEGRLKATLSRILQQIAADKSPVKTPVREGTETEDTMAAAMDETSVHLQPNRTLYHDAPPS